MTLIQILLGAIILVLAIFVLFGVFTQVETGTKKYITRGEEYIKTLLPGSKRFWLWEIFGVFFVGFSFLNYKIKKFSINADKENPEANPKDVKTWVIRQTKTIDSLWDKIPRFLVFTGLETSKGVQVDLGIRIVFELIDGETFGFTYRTDFGTPSDLILSKVRERISGLSEYQEVLALKAEFLEDLLTDSVFVAEIEEFGLRIKIIKLQYISADDTIEAAARLETEAKMKGQATIASAEAEAEAILIRMTAEAKGRQLAEAAIVVGFVESLRTQFPQLSDQELAELAKDAIANQKLPSNLQVLAQKLFAK